MSYTFSESAIVMSSFGSTHAKEQKKTSFWKKNAKSVPGNIKPVYGAQHPPIRQEFGEAGTSRRDDQKMLRRTKDSFQDFQENTSDAWDDGDDELILMANVKMSLKDVHSTAMEVLNNHSKNSQKDQLGNHSDEAVANSNHMAEAEMISHKVEEQLGQIPSPSPQTPTHLTGPGVGVRLSTKWPVDRSSHYRYPPAPPGAGNADREAVRLEKFKTTLAGPNTNLDELRRLSWSGICRDARPTTWKILSGYLPGSLDRRELTLERKRNEYFGFVEQYYDTRHQEINADTFRQIHIDIPRMNPLLPLFQQKIVQELFERILYIWAIRHPASGYVQGINDLVTPFFVVFLSEHIESNAEIDNYDMSKLSKETLSIIEADSFWCTSKLLDGIQDNYTFAQPGIQLKVNALKELIKRIDVPLYNHLERHHVEFLQFAFRWMNNLLMRELPLRCTIRLWDTYLAEPEGFANFHLYVCAALLVKFSQDLLREKDFQGLMLLLQNLPTHHWHDEEIGLLLAEAYKLKFMFADAPNHLSQKS